VQQRSRRLARLEGRDAHAVEAAQHARLLVVHRRAHQPARRLQLRRAPHGEGQLRLQQQVPVERVEGVVVVDGDPLLRHAADGATATARCPQRPRGDGGQAHVREGGATADRVHGQRHSREGGRQGSGVADGGRHAEEEALLRAGGDGDVEDVEGRGVGDDLRDGLKEGGRVDGKVDEAGQEAAEEQREEVVHRCARFC